MRNQQCRCPKPAKLLASKPSLMTSAKRTTAFLNTNCPVHVREITFIVWIARLPRISVTQRPPFRVLSEPIRRRVALRMQMGGQNSLAQVFFPAQNGCSRSIAKNHRNPATAIRHPQSLRLQFGTNDQNILVHPPF